MVVGAHGPVIHLALLRVVAASKPDDGSVIIPHQQMVEQTVKEVLPVNASVAPIPVQLAPIQAALHLLHPLVVRIISKIYSHFYICMNLVTMVIMFGCFFIFNDQSKIISI